MGIDQEQRSLAIPVMGPEQAPIQQAADALETVQVVVQPPLVRVVRKRLGTRKASFASSDQTVELTGMQIGGVTPFGTTTAR